MFSSFILSLWIVSVCLCPLVRVQAAVVGPSLPVLALAGEDVILPCRCDPARDLGTMTVEWSRTDVQPDPADPLKRVKFVHMYTERQEDMDMKIDEFVNRTQLFLEQLGAGNASLRIQRVRLSDNGTYKCFIPNLRAEAYATLIVRPVEAASPKGAPDTEPELNIDSTSPTPQTLRSRLPAVVSLVVLVALFVAVVLFLNKKEIIYKLQKQHDKPQFEKQREPESAAEERVGSAEERVGSAEEETLLSVECPTDDTQRSTLQAG